MNGVTDISCMRRADSMPGVARTNFPRGGSLQKAEETMKAWRVETP